MCSRQATLAPRNRGRSANLIEQQVELRARQPSQAACVIARGKREVNLEALLAAFEDRTRQGLKRLHPVLCLAAPLADLAVGAAGGARLPRRLYYL